MLVVPVSHKYSSNCNMGLNKPPPTLKKTVIQVFGYKKI